MSKINTCDVVKDLMPMYMDGLLSESSRQMMNEHMQTCEKCKMRKACGGIFAGTISLEKGELRAIV